MTLAMTANSMTLSQLATIENDERFGVGIKYDGFREIMHVDEHGNIKLFNRSGADHTDNIMHITGFTLPQLAGTILDGEGIGPTGRIESTKSVFGSSPEYARQWQEDNGLASYFIFDVLTYKGKSVVSMPLRERMVILEEAYQELYAAGVRHISIEVLHTQHKREIFDGVVERGGEGIMIKDLYAPYTPGKRTNAWRKLKKIDSWDVVILGFTSGKGKYVGVVGAIVYGAYSRGELVEIGKSSGMTDSDRRMFAESPGNYIGTVVEISGQEIGKDGAIRFPRFVRLRDDKLPTECVVGFK